MLKKQAVELFGTRAELARGLGYHRSRISQWPEVLTQQQTDHVVGAAVRLGKPIKPILKLISVPQERKAA